jgi:hypothetical protein
MFEPIQIEKLQFPIVFLPDQTLNIGILKKSNLTRSQAIQQLNTKTFAKKIAMPKYELGQVIFGDATKKVFLPDATLKLMTQFNKLSEKTKFTTTNIKTLQKIQTELPAQIDAYVGGSKDAYTEEIIFQI